MRSILAVSLLVLTIFRGGLTTTGENPRVSATYSSLVAPGTARATPKPVLLALAITPAPTPVATRPPTALPATPKPADHKHPAIASTSRPRLAASKPTKVKAATPRPRAKPTTKPTPAPQRSKSYSKQDVKQRIAATWDGDDEKALNVVSCETAGTFNPAMTSANGQYFGLWQFNMDTWRAWGGQGDPRDASPETQTQIAQKLFNSRGWEPWPYCSTH